MRQDTKETRAMNAKLDASRCMQQFYQGIKGLRAKRMGSLQAYRSRMLRFFRDTHIDPDAWLADVKTGKRDSNADFVAYLRNVANDSSVSDNTLIVTRAAILKFCKVLGVLEPRLPDVEDPELKRETEPFTKQDIERMLEACNQRDRVIILLAATTGARVSELAGLRVKDMGEIFTRSVEPYAISIPDKIAKGGRGYVSFTTEECAKSIRQWVAQNNLKQDSILLCSSRQMERVFAANIPTGLGLGLGLRAKRRMNKS